MRPCHRAVANTPPSGSPLRSVFDAPCCLHPAPKSSALGQDFSRLLCVYWSLRPDDLLTILKMALSIARDLVSLFPAIQATRFLTFTSVGLPPTEHISIPPFFPGCTAAQSPRPPMPLVYASRNTSRCPLQDSRSGWIRYFLSCRALASPTTCRFIPAHSGFPVIRQQRPYSGTLIGEH